MIAKLIADLGEDPLFVAFNAHCWFAFAIVYFAAVHGAGLPVAGVAVVAAALKEFAFDAFYEHDPPQTFWDNLEDFGGYCAGVLLALGAALL